MYRTTNLCSSSAAPQVADDETNLLPADDNQTPASPSTTPASPPATASSTPTPASVIQSEDPIPTPFRKSFKRKRRDHTEQLLDIEKKLQIFEKEKAKMTFIF